ncbi:hypothetical protein CEXT_321031 [Caerostris extrusa]|uniref:Uncharacterized protein n=1 Tax=Caerostris extrusa TaxID=172846 RepID=A0AAV4NUQ2_CAEEX|nr:hypothetical protein CEXT_321031 [Caerostris extrusa]
MKRVLLTFPLNEFSVTLGMGLWDKSSGPRCSSRVCFIKNIFNSGTRVSEVKAADLQKDTSRNPLMACIPVTAFLRQHRDCVKF